MPAHRCASAFALPLLAAVLMAASDQAFAFQASPALDSKSSESPLATSASIITTVVGNGFMGDSGNGDAASSATLLYPEFIAADTAGNLYISDFYMGVVRKVSANTGKISIFAGTFGVSGYSGDGGPATPVGNGSNGYK